MKEGREDAFNKLDYEHWQWRIDLLPKPLKCLNYKRRGIAERLNALVLKCKITPFLYRN